MRATTEKRKIYKEQGLLGIDTRQSADSRHASRMENLLLENGALRKRNGFTDVMLFEDENAVPLSVNGIYEVGKRIIVHAGKYLFDCGSDISAQGIFKKPKRISTSVLLKDEPLDAFCEGDTLWILNENGLFVLKDDTLMPLSSVNPYTPTTRRSIEPTSNGSTYVTGEDESILTARRKNTLFGKKAELSTYELDSFMDESKGFTVTCRMRVSLTDGENEAHFIGHKQEKRVDRSSIMAVAGGASDEVYNIFEGKGTAYGFDALTEVNVFLKKPICITSLVLRAKSGSTVPQIKLTYGASTVYEASTPFGTEVKDLTSAVSGRLVDGITLYGNSTASRINVIELFGNELYEGDVILRYEQGTSSIDTGYTPTSIKTPGGEAVSLYQSQDGTKKKSPVISFSRGEEGTLLHIYFEAPGYIQERSNIEIAFSKENASLPKILLARECKTATGKRAIGFALEGGQVCFTDEKIGIKYAPRSNLARLGGDGEITAICQMQDFVIGVYKEKTSFFVRLGEYGIEYSGAMESIGCINNRCAITINRDTLTLSSDGVYGLQGYDKYGKCLRSGGIDRILREQSLKNAHALGYDGRLYIFFDNLCLVADTRIKSRYEQSVDDSFEYEWFMLSGFDARCSAVLGSKMYIGTADGKIRTLSQAFLDVSLQKIGTGEALVVEENGAMELCINESLGDLHGKEISISGAKALICIQRMQQDAENEVMIAFDSTEIFNKNGTIKLFSGMEIYGFCGGDEYYRGEILYLDEQEGFAVTSLPTGHSYKAILKDTQSCKITLERGEIGYKMLCEGSELTLFDYDNMELVLVSKSPVCAIYESARLDLGAPHLSKTLHRISFDLLPKTGTELILGYETSRSSTCKTVLLGNKFSVNSLDFNSFSFGIPIEKICTLRLFERGVGYVIVKLKSSSCGAFELNGYSIVYTTNGLLVADR